MEKENKKQSKEQKETSLRKFLFAAVSELWSYEIWTYIIMGLLIRLLVSAAKNLVLTRDDALTTSNLAYVLLSPQGVLIIVIAIIVVLIYIAIELFGEIIFVGNIFAKKNKGWVFRRIFSAIAEGFKSLKVFFNPLGILCIFYVFIITPIVGLGFSIRLTEKFYIPHFIMDVIRANMLFVIPYIALIIFLAIVGFLHFFVFHGVLINK